MTAESSVDLYVAICFNTSMALASCRTPPACASTALKHIKSVSITVDNLCLLFNLFSNIQFKKAVISLALLKNVYSLAKSMRDSIL